MNRLYGILNTLIERVTKKQSGLVTQNCSYVTNSYSCTVSVTSLTPSSTTDVTYIGRIPDDLKPAARVLGVAPVSGSVGYVVVETDGRVGIFRSSTGPISGSVTYSLTK